MLDISPSDTSLLTKSIEEGNTVLFLGAGTSQAALNNMGQNVKMGRDLAEGLAGLGGLQYSGESLPEVLQAIGNRVSESQRNNYLIQQLTRIRPSKELADLFRYTWKRVYTWNIDDAIENVEYCVQSRRYFNGMTDSVIHDEGIEYLHVIHLHGEALKIDKGIIFSPTEYNQRIRENRHDWYRQAAADYSAHVPVFIGTRINEPIFSSELDRARPHPGSSLGVAFLITPDEYTPLQLEGFRARNIVYVKGTLGDFVKWIAQAIDEKLTPLEISKQKNAFTDKLAARIRPTRTEINTANSIRVQTWQDVKSKSDELQGLLLKQTARSFLEGDAPTWRIAASNIPVWLTATNELYTALWSSIDSKDRMFLVYGQSGSGKTTALLQSLLKCLRENNIDAVYELTADVKSLKAALELISRVHPHEHAVVYIGDAFLYGDVLREDVLAFPRGKFTLISSARSNEWREHIERHVGDFTTSFEFQRFQKKDHMGLIERLLAYVPSPKFLRMTSQERQQKLASSQEQLLIALKETTTSEKFTRVITEEFGNLPDYDTKALFLIVGLATIARSGISRSTAMEAYSVIRKELSFEGALRNLEGIVSSNPSNRLVARHELYVRHIIENVASFDSIVTAAVEVLRTFTKYKVPIVKNVGRLDSLLFKFALNHNFIGDLARRRNDMIGGLRIFESFEIEFQLDGHYWLQYGQYLKMCGEYESAMGKLRMSIQAFPDNIFAVHALADLQLLVARNRPAYDPNTVSLIGDAVQTLEGLHATQSTGTDFYPIVTLANDHISALIKHRQVEAAKAAARKYFRMIEAMPRTDEPIDKARERLMHYVTHGVWGRVTKTDHGRAKRRRPKRHRS